MSYTLGLLFEYHRYRHDAIVRVYADNRLVDELSLSSDIKMKCTNVVGMPPNNRFIGPRNETPVQFTPEKLFLFEIDERHLCNRIRIEVQNDHNNYTNGFMTEFSYVKFRGIFLFPSCLLEHDNWMRLRVRLSGRPMKSNLHLMTWADVFPRGVSPHEITLRPDIIQNKNDEHWNGHILGGSFSMDIPLSRKHGVIHLGRLRPGTIYVNSFFSSVLGAFGQLNTST